MSEVSKFINLMIEFGQKIESSVHKKYKPFIRSTLNLQNLAKNVNSNNKVFLTTQIIVFKLGLESKSNKCIEVSLFYLHKLFASNFIDLDAPNYCENYIIQEDGLKPIIVHKYQKEIRHEIVRLLEPLVHFKNNEINQLLLKNYQYLLGEPIIQPLLQVCYSYPNEFAYTVITSFFNQRIYLYEQFRIYTQKQIQSAQALLPHHPKLNECFKKALTKNDKFKILIQMYFNQALSRGLIKEGGKYGFCVICKQPAEHYCKVTQASVCSLQCKKKHLAIAQGQYKQDFQARILQKEIIQGMSFLMQCICRKQNVVALSILVEVTDNPSLFMILCHNFRKMFKNYIPKLLLKLQQSKNEQIISYFYLLMGNFIKWWPVQSFSSTQYFINNHINKIFDDKKPKFNLIMLAFKTLSKIVQNGKNFIEIYVNFDSQPNNLNIIQKMMFEIAKMCQDKFANATFFSKQEKTVIKNSCITIYQMIAKGINEFRKINIKSIEIQHILLSKQKKISLQKFCIKFNEHWSSGLKSLFNMNMVGLDSNEEIVDIILNTKGLKKEQIDKMMFCEAGYNYLNTLKKKISEEKGLLRKFIKYYRYMPFKKGSLSQKIFIDTFQATNVDIHEKVENYFNVIAKMSTLDDFKKITLKEEVSDGEIDGLYSMALQIRKDVTMGSDNSFYQHCSSQSYIRVLNQHLSLLQIPISFLLQSFYDLDRILVLVVDLMQICDNSNWVGMLIKSSGVDGTNTIYYSSESMKIIKTILQIVMQYPKYIVDWMTVLLFIRNIHSILMVCTPKKVTENRILLSQQISVGMLQKCIMNASENIDKGFGKFVKTMLMVAKQDLKQQRQFMLQKYFQLLEFNIEKYIQNFDQIFLQLKNLVIQMPDSDTDNLIYIADMVKSSLLKLLKTQIQPTIQLSYFQLLSLLSHKYNKQTGEFVMNCLTMIIVHHYTIAKQSWQVVFQIIKDHAKAYRSQVQIITQKIISQNLRGCQQMGIDLIRLCLALVDPQQDKNSIEVIHSIRKIIEFVVNTANLTNAKAVLNSTILQMTKFVRFSCHQSAIQMIFLLLQIDKANGQAIFNSQDLFEIFNEIYNEIQQLPAQNIGRGEKVMNQSLYWSVKHKNYQIISNLEGNIIGKNKQLSHTAAKCLKTYIQMLNPKQKSEWLLIEATLVRIIKDSKLSNYIANHQMTAIDIKCLTKKLIIQKLAVQLLPNDACCLDILKQIYQQSISFNDNIGLRKALWKEGMGQRGEQIPNILNLQEVISNRIMAIFNSTNNYKEMFVFGVQILDRYRFSSIQLKRLIAKQTEIAQLSNSEFEQYKIQFQYLQIRIIPLSKIITYMLPKLQQICENIEERQIMVKRLISILPFVERRQPYLKTIREITQSKKINQSQS